MTAMTLKDFVCARPEEDEFTVYDKDYDTEVYFYHPDMNEKWDIAMDEIAGLLTVVDYKEATEKDNPCATVDLSGLIERNIDNGVFKDLFIHNDIDAIMDDIMNIFAGYVSEEWLTDFAESLR